MNVSSPNGMIRKGFPPDLDDQPNADKIEGGSMVSSFSLDGEWSLAHRPLENFNYLSRPTENAIAATVPGDVHLDLMRHGDIDDPLLRDNAAKCAWIGTHEWWYEKRFKSDFIEGARHDLVFEGLCYVADIWLNGAHIGHHVNMHRPLKIDVTKSLNFSRDNLLVVRLLAFDDASLDVPVISRDTSWDLGLAQWSLGIPNLDYCFKRGATHKALYSFGWDWTQGLSICGIWRGVRIESTPAAKIENLFVKTSQEGAVDLSFETDSNLRKICGARAVLSLREKISGIKCATVEFSFLLGPGRETYKLSAKLDNPRLWWPAGLGEQFLYEAEIVLYVEARLADQVIAAFGIRSVEICEGKLSETQGTLKFVINGNPVFLKGANWIPPDIIPPRATRERYKTLLRQTVEAGMNYLRFWGGGIYESHLFYELCDELGIMVWQDMMFSCMEVPDFLPDYVEESKREIEWFIKSVRNHPSIILWCGSNETDVLLNNMGKAARPNGRYYGHRLLHDVFPDIFKALDPIRTYIPSCPSLGKFSPPGSQLRDANAISFGTFHGNFANAYASDSELDAGKTPSFLNECYANSPDLECSLKRYLNESDLATWDNPIFDIHNVMNVQFSNEHALFSDKIYFHASDRFPDILMREKFAAFHDNHCELITRYTEFLRRRKDVCGGVAFWMLNSAFTMEDWSLIDYYCVPKPAYYAAKRANATILPIIAIYDERLDFYVSSDSLLEADGELVCEVRTFAGMTLFRESRCIKIKPNVSELHASIKRESFGNASPADCFAQVSLRLDSKDPQFNHKFLTVPRALRLPVANVTIEAVDGRPGAFAISSDRFVRNLTLFPHDDNRPDDNFFDLLPGVQKTVVFMKPLPLESVKLAWRNDKLHECLITAVSKPSHGKWTYTVFNTTDKKLSIPVEVTGTDGCLLDFPDAIELDALGVAQVPVSIGMNPFKMDSKNPTLSINLRIGSACVLDSLLLKRNFSFKKGGLFEITNNSKHPLQEGPIIFRCKTISGENLKLETPPVIIPARGSFVHDFNLSSECLPHTCELWEKDRKLCSFWGELMSTEELWRSLPMKPFTGNSLKAFETKGEAPDLFSEGHGYFVEPGMQCKNLDWINETKGCFAFFLHYNDNSLFLDIFVRNMPLTQRFSDDQVYKDSCIEFVAGYIDNSKYLDSSLALTRRGPELFRRRGHVGFSCGLSKKAPLVILDSPEDNISYYGHQFDLTKDELPELFDRGRFKMALVIRGANQARISLFNGVVVNEGVTKAGIIELI